MWNVRFVFIIFIFFINQSSYAKEIAGEIVSVAGIAFIRPDKSSEPLPKSPPRVRAGTNVYVGDVINTSSEGAVKILMRDKSIVDLGASSLFKVDEYIHNHGSDRKAKMDLMFGKVRVAVTKKIDGGGSFMLRTKGATMGVRGTVFAVEQAIPPINREEKAAIAALPKTEAPKQETKVVVMEGKVDVKPSESPKVEGGAPAAPTKTVSLTQNMSLTTGVPSANGAVMNTPVTLTSAQMKTEIAKTEFKDNTFTVNVQIAAPTNTSGANNDRSPGSEGSKGPAGPVLDLPPLPPVTAVLAGPIDVPGGRRDPFNNAPNTFRGTAKLHVTINFAQ